MHRRALLLGALGPALGACSPALPPLDTGSAPAARALLDASAAAHGGAALAGLSDVSASFAGAFNGFVNRLQPELVDIGYRGVSDERLLLRAGLVAQAHTGPAGRKQVVRRTAAGGPGDVRVWYDGVETTGADRRSRDLRAAASLVVDVDSVFLLGPMVLAGPWSTERSLALALAGMERVRVGGTDYACDVLRVRLAPGFGLSDGDDLVLLVDQGDRLVRQVRMSLNALDSTRGAVIEVDMAGYVRHAGVLWPTHWVERLLRPLPVHVHEWRLTGLDVNRGLDPAEVSGPAFTGRAAAPAAPWL